MGQKYSTRNVQSPQRLKQSKMEIPKETQERIAQLQLFEQNMHNFLSQKRNFQSQLVEIENALEELDATTETVYKIIGQVMLKSNKEKLIKSLSERKDILDLRIKSVEKQEKAVQEKAEKIQAEVMKEIEKHMEKKE